MSRERVKEYLKKYNMDNRIITVPTTSATVKEAAEALRTEEARIAKTLSFKKDDSCILVVTAGDMKIDNAKYKHTFCCKAKMLSSDEVVTLVGHEIGGVCPFAVADGVQAVYIDKSIQRFTTVFPACGSSNSAIELTPEQLFLYSHANDWVDVCKAVEQ